MHIKDLKQKIHANYLHESSSGCNLLILPDFIGLILKKIKKDEEIFVSYGIDYWITEEMHDATWMSFCNFEQDLNWKGNKIIADNIFQTFLESGKLERYKEFQPPAFIQDRDYRERRLDILSTIASYILSR